MKYRARMYTLWIAGFLVLGCQNAATVEIDADYTDGFSVSILPCNDFVVPQTFGLGWRKMNHRIAVYKIRPEDDQCDPKSVDVGFVGGDYSHGLLMRDRPEVQFAWQRIDTLNNPHVRATRLSITESLEADGGVASATISLTRDAVGLRDQPYVIALIQGLEFRTDVAQKPDFPQSYDPAHGYTSRGLGASVDVAHVDDDVIDLDYKIRFETGAAPDRGNLNAARPEARIGAVLDVLLVALDQPASRFGRVSFGADYGPLALRPAQRAWAPEDDRTLELDGIAGAPLGTFGFSSFDFQLDFRKSCNRDATCPQGDRCNGQTCELLAGPPGGYIRELLAGVEMESYDERTGRGRFLVDGYASTLARSVALRAMEHHFEAGVVWLQIDGASQPHSVRKLFRTGEFKLALE